MFTCLYVCMCVCACISVFACVLVCVVCRIHFKQLLYPPNTHTGAVECAWTVMEEKAMQLLFSGLVSKRSPRTGTSHSPISKKMDDFFLFFFLFQSVFIFLFLQFLDHVQISSCTIIDASTVVVQSLFYSNCDHIKCCLIHRLHLLNIHNSRNLQQRICISRLYS